MSSKLYKLLEEYLDSPKGPPSGIRPEIETELKRFVHWCEYKAAEKWESVYSADYCLDCGVRVSWDDKSHAGHEMLSENTLLILEKEDPPPTLGVSVSDGVGTKSSAW